MSSRRISTAPAASPRECGRAPSTSTIRGLDLAAPFGGYKQSGNGREYGEWGLDAFLELKGVVGYGAAAA